MKRIQLRRSARIRNRAAAQTGLDSLLVSEPTQEAVSEQSVPEAEQEAPHEAEQEAGGQRVPDEMPDDVRALILSYVHPTLNIGQVRKLGLAKASLREICVSARSAAALSGFPTVALIRSPSFKPLDLAYLKHARHIEFVDFKRTFHPEDMDHLLNAHAIVFGPTARIDDRCVGRLTNLRELFVTQNFFTVRCETRTFCGSALAALSNLKKITIDRIGDGFDYETLACLRHVEDIALGFVCSKHMHANADFDVIVAQFVSAKNICLSKRCGKATLSVGTLADLPLLRGLQLCNIELVADDDDRCAPQITALELVSSKTADATVSTLSGLRALYSDRCPDLTGECVASLGALTTLVFKGCPCVQDDHLRAAHERGVQVYHAV